jgi:hypothetical protein
VPAAKRSTGRDPPLPAALPEGERDPAPGPVPEAGRGAVPVGVAEAEESGAPQRVHDASAWVTGAAQAGQLVISGPAGSASLRPSANDTAAE